MLKTKLNLLPTTLNLLSFLLKFYKNLYFLYDDPFLSLRYYIIMSLHFGVKTIDKIAMFVMAGATLTFIIIFAVTMKTFNMN